MAEKGLRFKHTHYVPLLKGKDGEFKALRFIPVTTGVTPLIEVMPAGSVPLLNRLRLTVSKIKKNWGSRGAFFFDLEHVSSTDAVVVDGVPIHPAAHCFTMARVENLLAIPVVSPGRSAAFLTAVRAIATTDTRGACLRLSVTDLQNPTSLPARIGTVVDSIGLPLADIHLILDLRSSEGVSATNVAVAYRRAIDRIPTLAEWRTITIASAAFPASLAQPMPNGWNRRPRNDWLGWQTLISGGSTPSRLPSYGDYAISHPGLPTGGRARTLAQLRYSTPTEFLIWKGYDVQQHIDGYEQFHAICADMILQPEYRLPPFSWGDQQIQIKATTTGDPGGSPTWRAIGTSHHIATALDQIANLP